MTMSSIFKDTVVLVTGGTGSIGKSLIHQILKYPVRKVIVLSRDEIKQFLLRREISDSRLVLGICDIRDKSAIERVLRSNKQVDILYHAAAMKHVVVCEQNPIEGTLTNVLGTQNIVDLALDFNIPKNILISTDKAVEPTNVMGATKMIAERIFLNGAMYSSAQVFSVVRFGNVAGSRGSVIPIFIADILKRRRLTITNPDVTRFIMRIDDAINLIMKATELACGGEIFVLKMKAFRLGDLIEVMLSDVAPALNIDPDSIKLDTLGLTLGEKLHETLLFQHELQDAYETNEFYTIVKNFNLDGRYGDDVRGIKTTKHDSEQAPLMTRDELRKIVFDYIKQMELSSI